MERKVLGKGLAALIPEKVRRKSEGGIQYLEIDSIKPNKYQPRETFNKQKLDELISSIKEKGVIQPVLVRARDAGYELIAGERRLRAVKQLGIKEIPAMVRDVDDADMIGLALVENIQRDGLNPLEEAHAYQRLMDEFKYTQDKIGQVVGKDNTTISNTVRLLTLPKKIQDYLTNGAISVGHAKVLLSVDGLEARLDFSKRVVKNELSVRSLENLIRKKKTPKRKSAPDYNLRALEETLQQVFGTKVRITKQKKRGKIEIEFYSDLDLNRILDILKVSVI